MKLRFYMRGLGIGIVVTALMMGIASGQKEKLTDDEIRNRAAMLGMVDGGSVLSNLGSSAAFEESGKNESTQSGVLDGSSALEENPVSEASGEESAQSIADESTVEDGESGQQAGPGESTQEDGNNMESPEASQTASGEELQQTGNPVSELPVESIDAEQGTVIFAIQRGWGSESVSRGLQEAGLIDDAASYNRFLEENGYGNVISSGTFEIPRGASWYDIAAIITRRR